jgi:aspartate kinase
MRIVVKFGGTSLATAQHIKNAARKIGSLKRNGHEIAVVVSAMGNKTSELMKLLRAVNDRTKDISRITEVVGMGEVISARLMALALNKDGTPAKAITPDAATWPVHAQVAGRKTISPDKINQEGIAIIDMAKTSDACGKHLVPLLKKKIVPVICGFLARDENSGLIAIGRGGSDITATLLGRCLEADKVIIVTDVPGVMAGDPRLVKADRHLREITVKEIEYLSRGGARIIHPSALLYKLPSQKVVIADFRSVDLNRGGTEIVGSVGASVVMTRETLAFITVVGRKFLATAGLVQKISRRLSEKKISIYGISLSENYIGLYVAEKIAERAYHDIYSITRAEPRFRAVSIRKGVKRVCVTSQSFIEEPGVIGRIGDLLAMNNINIIEMNTIQSDITIFLNRSDAGKACDLLKAVKF